MKTILTAALLLAATTLAAPAASVSKSYSYFAVGGSTLDEIENELLRNGPKVKSSGQRHPGATQMEFTTRIGYAEQGGYCRVVQAVVSVKAKVILPKWRRTGRAETDVRLIWDTLASDIKRHEESHVIIAKNNARDMERALLAIPRQRDCKGATERAKAVTAKFLARHDAAQERFDRIEGINFESRILRLLRYRLERMQASAK